MSPSLVLAFACALQTPDEPVLSTDEFEEDPITAGDEAVVVKLVSGPEEPELLDVYSHGAPASEVLARIAAATGRDLKLEPGDAAPRASRPVDVHLRRRPLREVVTWVAGAAGLVGDVTRRDLRCGADLLESPTPEERLRRAIDAYRTALLDAPTQQDAPRLRFEIGNALYQLGEFLQATSAWHDLERDAPEFGDLPYVYFRCGHAHAQLGDEPGAQAQWFKLADRFPHHPLVAAARLEGVRSLQRQQDDVNAAIVLRLVVEQTRDLAPADLVTAGELLNQSGSHERAIAALKTALRSNVVPELEERALVILARAQGGLGAWSDVIATADLYARRHAEGQSGAEMQWLLATAHHELADPFTALLAVKHARELHPDDELDARCDLLEGTIYATCGIAGRAEPSLSRAGVCEFPDVAAPALAVHARLRIDQGQLESARHLYDRLATLRGHEVEAAIGRAEVSLLQHNRRLCLAVVQESLARNDVSEPQRARLLEIAAEALRGANEKDVLGLLDAPPAAAPAATPAVAAPPDPEEPPHDEP